MLGRDPLLKVVLDLAARGDLAGAVAQATIATQRFPSDAAAFDLLARLQLRLGNSAGAREAATRALQLQPATAGYQVTLGLISAATGQYEEAVACFSRAHEAEPHNAEICAHRDQALLALSQRKPEVLAQLVLARLEHSPIVPPELRAAYSLSANYGLGGIATLARARASALNDTLALMSALAIPAVNASVASIFAIRRSIEAALDDLLSREACISVNLADLPAPGFFLAYHGQGNRVLKEKFARLYLRLFPELAWQAPLPPPHAAERIRVGFVSRNFCGHSIAKTSRGLIANLARERFEVVTIFVPPLAEDATSEWIAAHSDHVVRLDEDLSRGRQQIAEQNIDILFYQDIGMDSLSYKLACARLAPVQCVSFGHPDTTGIANLDYFISSAAYEAPDAQAHYSENLFLLRDLPTLAYYYRPAITPPEPTLRRTLGIQAHEHFYFCPQMTFKFHPEFDGILARILREDRKGRLVIIRGVFDDWTDALTRRFQMHIADVAGRIIVLDRMPSDRFLTLLAAADVVLDTPHFNGMNTSLEAFAASAPVVTYPTNLQRGRHTAAMYRAMGLADCVATGPDSYVDLALRLAGEPEFRREFVARIDARSGMLFENAEVLGEFERFFVAAYNSSRNRR